MNLDLDRLFGGGRVPDWLRAFDADPRTALQDLLLGRAELGHLTIADPVDLLLGWLRTFGDSGGFSGLLDRSLRSWIDDHWGKTELPGGLDSATLTTAAWTRAADLLAAAPALVAAGDTLTRRVTADRRYLNSLAEGRSRDPQASAWRALAAHQRDRSLRATWWGLCDLPPDEPWYRGHCGIAGLRGMPPESAARAGGFPKEVAEGLNRLGLALWRLQDEGWVGTDLAREEFQDALRLVLGAYPFPDRWVSFWRHALGRDRGRGDIADWIRGPLPQIGSEPRGQWRGRQTWANYDPSWTDRAKAIAGALVRGETGAIEKAERLLSEQRCYFEQSGDGGRLVRSATNFSRAVRSRSPVQALAWARLAKEVEPWNGYAWTNEGQSLLALGDRPAALDVYREAKTRFPDNVFARTGLAEVLKAQDRLAEAEAEYREAKARFPDDVFARTGLAEVLKAQERLAEAEAEYREAKARFPDDVFAEVLKAQDRLAEAEAEYREAKARFPDKFIERIGLTPDSFVSEDINEAELFPEDSDEQPAIGGSEDFASGSVDESGENTKPAVAPGRSDSGLGLNRREIDIIANDAFLVRGWARSTHQFRPDRAQGFFRERAETLLARLLPAADSDSFAAGESGLLELDRGELDHALELLRRAVTHFPGSARVRYALARAEREAAQGDPVSPWRRLLRLDKHYEPIFFLGAGRALLARAGAGGDRVEDDARDKLGQLAFWVHGRIEPTGYPMDLDADPRTCFRPRRKHDFAGWWAVEVQSELFGSRSVVDYRDLADLVPIRGRVLDHGSSLDRLEEEIVLRYARA